VSGEQALAEAASPPDSQAATTGRRGVVVPVEITAIQGAGDHVELVLPDGRRLLHATRPDHQQTRLPPAKVQVHRANIANMAHAQALERDGDVWKLRATGSACGACPEEPSCASAVPPRRTASAARRSRRGTVPADGRSWSSRR